MIETVAYAMQIVGFGMICISIGYAFGSYHA